MKLSDKIFFLKNKIVRKDNILFIIILSIILVAIFACLTITNFSIVMKNSQMQSEGGRTLYVPKPTTDDGWNALRNIEHIEFIENKKYVFPLGFKSKQFTDELLDGNVQLAPILNNTKLKIVKGRGVHSSGEIICPSKFYPYSLFVEDEDDQYVYNPDELFFHSRIINANKMIGKKIKLEDSNKENHEFKLVGTYKPIPLKELNICYLSKSDFDKYKECSTDDCAEENSLMVIVDERKNLEFVENELLRINLGSDRMFIFEEDIFLQLTYIPMFISLIILIVCLTIIYNFFKKKVYLNQYENGILKSLGYSNKAVVSLARIEGTLIYFTSIMISLILYFIGYFIITKFYLGNVNYYNFVTPIPYLYMFIFMLLSFFYIFLITGRFTKIHLRKCIQNLFEDR